MSEPKPKPTAEQLAAMQLLSDNFESDYRETHNFSGEMPKTQNENGTFTYSEFLHNSSWRSFQTGFYIGVNAALAERRQ